VRQGARPTGADDTRPSLQRCGHQATEPAAATVWPGAAEHGEQSSTL